MPQLAGKHVLIIGGSSGIGFGVARAALAEGAIITIASSNEGKLRAAASRLGGGNAVRTEILDVAQESAVKAFFENVDIIDHLVFSAGDSALLSQDIATLNFEVIKSFMDVRFFSVLLCARYSKGRIIESFTVTSGTTAMRPTPGISNLIGGGGALMSATRGLALDLAPVRVNCVVPGLVMTEMLDAMSTELREGLVRSYAEKMPLGHIGTPEEIAEAYLFTMKCSYLTGQTIVVDGGSTLV